MNDTTVNNEPKADTAAEAGNDDPPILFLHGIDRHYRQGDVTLDILKGAELAIWPGQSVARCVASRRDRPRIICGSITFSIAENSISR